MIPQHHPAVCFPQPGILRKNQRRYPQRGQAGFAGLRHQGVLVRLQPVAHPDAQGDGVVKRFPRLAELPDLPGRIRPVRPHHGQEAGILRPPDKEFPVSRIVFSPREFSPPEPRILRIGEKPADITVPERFPGGHEVQPFRDMPPERFPGGADVAAPGHGRIPVLPGPGGPRHRQHALLPFLAPLPFIQAACVAQAVQADFSRVQVGFRLARVPLHPLLVRGALMAVPVAFKGLRAVRPPGVHALRVQAAGLPPVDLPRFRQECVVGGAVPQHAARPQKLLPVFIPVALHMGPDGEHQPRVLRVHPVDKPFREARAVRLFQPPLPFRPGQPVLHDHVQRNPAAAVFVHHPGQLFGVHVAFL